MMNKWMDTYKKILVHDLSASCPNCGSSNVRCEYVLVEPKSQMGCGAVWCDDCHSAMPLSRVNLDGLPNIVKKLPDNLIF